MRRTLQRVMARLTDLLDEDQFGNIESIVKEAGVEPPAMAAAAPADERAAFDVALAALNDYQRKWDTGTPTPYAQSERIAMECACEAVRDALEEARAAASPAAEAADRSEAPLIGRWHHGNGVLVCGSIRVAVESFDTQPSQEFMGQMFDWICETLNAAIAAPQPAQADALDEEQRDALNEAICWANDDGLPGTADQLRSILALHEQADAPAEAREPVCKLCRSTGLDVPCAYPTEINRQQAKRIAELESRLSVNVDPHPDDVAVDSFAAVMKHKLALARDKGRGGWETCSPVDLSRMLREHVEKGDLRDVANFCMMLWHHGSPIVSAPADAGSGDAIARSKRILALVDEYHEKPTSDNRTSLRKALMAEFETAPPTARMASLLDHFIMEYGHLLAQRLKLVYYDIADRDAQLRALLNGSYHD
ncbi:hypothetical protein BGV72_31545 [Burkholderia ubonensis]|nr:hypothetical protein BGV72_31545 [Burkholderia ubonensis]